MKKVFLIFIALFMSIFMVSCKASKEQELYNFFDSHSLDYIIKIKTNDGEFNFMKIVSTKNVSSLEITDELGFLPKFKLVVENEKNLFCYFNEEIIYVNLESRNTEKKEKVINEYISNIRDNGEHLVFDFDIGKYMEGHTEYIIEGLQMTGKIIFTCLYNEKGKLSKIKYVNQGVELIIQVNAYTNNKRKDAEDIGIKEIEVPEIEKCKSFTYEELNNYLSLGVACCEIDLELNDLAYGFKIGDYAYLCDKKYLYKYDAKFTAFYGKLDLKCQGISHYVKDGYLYVAAHYPYTTTYNDSDSYDGSVTQINLYNFSIVKQVHVKCLPESIIVDNRGYVYLSRGANQHVNNVQVNMETGELTPIFSGYQGDILLYDSVNDAIIALTPRITSDNYIYKYDGSKWVKEGIASMETPKVYYKENDSYVSPYGIYEFDSLTNAFVLNAFELEKLPMYYINYAAADSEIAYILGSNKYDEDKVNILVVYDLETDQIDAIQIPKKYQSNVTFAYVYSGDLYVGNTNGSIIRFKSLK